MKKPINVEVRSKKNEPIDKLIRRFSKKVKKELIIEEVRERRYYEKPSEVRAKLKKKKKLVLYKLKENEKRD